MSITDMGLLESLEFIHFAMQEAQSGNPDELDTALELLELIREQHWQEGE